MSTNDIHLKSIIQALESNRCLVFLGAGASVAYRNGHGREVAGVPSSDALAESLAGEYRLAHGPGDDLLTVSEYCVYAEGGDRAKLEKSLQEKIRSCTRPRPIHTVLAQLQQVRVIVTTNYDTLLEGEFERYGRKAAKAVFHRTSSTNAHFRRPFEIEHQGVIFHKMLGCIDVPDSMVLTDSDFIRYLADLNDADRGMPEMLRKTMIPQSTLLFLGFRLDDWYFRVVWHGLIARLANHRLRADRYALVDAPDTRTVRYWEKQRLTVVDQDLTAFAIRLADHFKLDIPQLDIEHGSQP